MGQADQHPWSLSITNLGGLLLSIFCFSSRRSFLFMFRFYNCGSLLWHEKIPSTLSLLFIPTLSSSQTPDNFILFHVNKQSTKTATQTTIAKQQPSRISSYAIHVLSHRPLDFPHHAPHENKKKRRKKRVGDSHNQPTSKMKR